MKTVLLRFAVVGATLWLACLPASADRIDDLEKMVRDLAEQNAALQSQVRDLQGEVSKLRVEQPLPAPSTPAQAPAPVGPEFTYGGDIRVRGVRMDNMWNFDLGGYDDSWEWYRQRSRIWLRAEVEDGLAAYLRGANEYKWGIGEKKNTLLVDDFAKGYDVDTVLGNKEWFVDGAYIDWTAPGGADWLTLRIGRQDMIYGEGFVILDGQSNVGSMAIAFDAIKGTIDLGEDTKADLIYSKIHEHNKQSADDEDLFGLYVKTDIWAPLHLEPYVLHRNKNDADVYFGAGFSSPGDSFIDPALDTTMVGLRGTLPLMDGDLLLVGEGGYQWGTVDDPAGYAFLGTDSEGESDVDRRAWALYGYGKYTWSDANWKPYVKAGYYYMSGDDPDSEDYEGWDSFYAEWPKWSEGLIYQLYDPFLPTKLVSGYGPTDRDLGTWTNMQIALLEVGCNPMKGTSLLLSYQYLWADEDTSLLNPDENDRGQLITALLTQKFTNNLTGHLLGEYFIPGDYYDPEGSSDDADDALFARWELMLSF